MSDATPIDNGGPAFPVPSVCNANGDVQYGTDGMSLRQWYAGQALNGILSQSPAGLFSHANAWKAAIDVEKQTNVDWTRGVALLCLQFADALIEAEKGTQ